MTAGWSHSRFIRYLAERDRVQHDPGWHGKSWNHHGRIKATGRAGVELMWLTGRLARDFKTIADLRKDNDPAIRAVPGD